MRVGRCESFKNISSDVVSKPLVEVRKTALSSRGHMESDAGQLWTMNATHMRREYPIAWGTQMVGSVLIFKVKRGPSVSQPVTPTHQPTHIPTIIPPPASRKPLAISTACGEKTHKACV